ncbi:MAG: response regulator [Verrucomicrobiota bacterium]
MRILLVEPDARERRKFSRALTLEGYSVRAARDNREAVRLFLAHPVDLLLVSQREPALDGVVTFELLSAIKPSWPAIVVTPPPPHRVLDQRLSIRVMIEKPSGLPVLFGVLRQLLQRQCSSPGDRGARSSRVEDGCPFRTNHDEAAKAARVRFARGPTRPKPGTGQHWTFHERIEPPFRQQPRLGREDSG